MNERQDRDQDRPTEPRRSRFVGIRHRPLRDLEVRKGTATNVKGGNTTGVYPIGTHLNRWPTG